MRHTIVIECPDNRDDARIARAVTQAIEKATHLWDPVAGSDIHVVEWHYEDRLREESTDVYS